MKPIQPRARPPVQTDLFGTTSAPAPLTILQLHRNELVDLLSQLLWQVVQQVDVVQLPEDDDEQDQP